MYFLKILFIYLFVYLLIERGEGRRKRERSMTQKHQLVASHIPTRNQSTTEACALIGNQTGDLSLCGTTPNQLSHAGQCGRPKLMA